MADFIVERASSFGLSAVCRLMTYGFYDWQGYLPFGGIVRCLLSVNGLSFRHGFLDKDIIEEKDGILLFVMRVKISLTEEFYQKTRRYSQQDILVSSKLLSLGKSSVCTNITVTDRDNGKEIGKCNIKFVFVDSKTRRTSNIPTWFFQKYEKHIDQNHSPEFKKSDISQLPEHVFKSSVSTRYEDIDINNHLNTARYMSFCLECATSAALAGFYRYFNSNMAAHPVLEFDATYLKECGPNEELTVITWQDEIDFQMINFAIYLNDKPLFNAYGIFRKEPLPPVKPVFYAAKL